MIELKVGSKGELFLPKSLRENLGLKPGDKLYLELKNDTIIIKKIPDLLELLNLPPISKPMTPEEIDKELGKEQEKQIEYSLGDLND